MKKSGCVILVLFFALCASIFVNGLLLVGLGARSAARDIVLEGPLEYEERVIIAGPSDSKILVIPMEGIIAYGVEGSLGYSMVEDLKIAFRQAAEDETVKAVVMVVDSPGGEITASDTIYHEIRKLRETKPVVFYMQSIGASGAYYAACGSSWIMCNPTTFTGSIGVIISTLNYKDLFGKIGLDAIIFKSGKFKDMLNGARDLTLEEADYVQGLVMQSYSRFVGIVAEARKLDEQKLRAGVADGRILSGVDAYEAELVDELGYVEDAYLKAAELAGVSNASIVTYERRFSLGSFFRLFGESQGKTRLEIDVLQDVHILQPGRTYLLPAFFAP